MLQIQAFPWRVRERTTGWFAVIVASMVFAMVAAQIAQWFGEQSRSDSISISSPSTAPGLATSSLRQLPMTMTIPFAIAKAQQDVVAQLRRTRDAARHRLLQGHTAVIRRNLTGLNGARGLIAGLAVAQALGGSSHH